ncbi:MAG: hypothetical protein PWQ16_833 [bacterium]|nr:MAG: hypothetical protein XD52_1354 [bacterium 42_11]MDK2871481.1 hypothetical protein [bacterium]
MKEKDTSLMVLCLRRISLVDFWEGGNKQEVARGDRDEKR